MIGLGERFQQLALIAVVIDEALDRDARHIGLEAEIGDVIVVLGGEIGKDRRHEQNDGANAPEPYPPFQAAAFCQAVGFKRHVERPPKDMRNVQNGKAPPM
jgi:hypothetical protein